MPDPSKASDPLPPNEVDAAPEKTNMSNPIDLQEPGAEVDQSTEVRSEAAELQHKLKGAEAATPLAAHWSETVMGDARLWGLVGLASIAIAFSKRNADSDAAVWLFLVIVAILIVSIVNTHKKIRVSEYRRIFTGLAVLVTALSVWFTGQWLTAPKAHPGLSEADVAAAVEAGIAKSQSMKLALEINALYANDHGMLYTDSKAQPHANGPLYVLVGMAVSNAGTVPTTAHSWASVIEVPNREPINGHAVEFSKNNKTLSVQGGGKIIEYSFDDFLTQKTNKLISQGETVPGLLMFRFEGLANHEVVPGSRLCISCADSRQNTYPTCYYVTNENNSLNYFAVPGARPEVRDAGR